MKELRGPFDVYGAPVERTWPLAISVGVPLPQLFVKETVWVSATAIPVMAKITATPSVDLMDIVT